MPQLFLWCSLLRSFHLKNWVMISCAQLAQALVCMYCVVHYKTFTFGLHALCGRAPASSPLPWPYRHAIREFPPRWKKSWLLNAGSCQISCFVNWISNFLGGMPRTHQHVMPLINIMCQLAMAILLFQILTTYCPAPPMQLKSSSCIPAYNPI
jgi:hypothetical protein